MPDREFSETEKRVLSLFPKVTASSAADGSFEDALETYIQDQMPFRNTWVGLCARFNVALGQNGTDGVYAAADGYLINTPTENDLRKLTANLKYLNTFAAQSGRACYLLPVPQTGYILEEKLPKRHKPYTDDDFYDTILQKADALTLVDIREQFLARKNDTQLYYRTDHHWTADGAHIAANAFLQAAGRPALRKTDFEVEAVPGFYGTTYSKLALWNKQPDTMELWHMPQAAELLHVAVRDLGKDETTENNDVFFTEHLTEYDRYPVYLNGNHSFTHIVNDGVSDGVLLLLKDSFGNTLASELAAAYHEILMIDLRYYRTEAVSALLDSYNVDTVLVNYSTDSLVTDSNILWLK